MVTVRLVYGLTSAHVAALIVFLIILDAYAVNTFLRKQKELLAVFRLIHMYKYV